MLKHIGIFLLAGIIGAFCLEFGERIGIPGVHGLVSPAEATVGRPLTPVSVAGVARRTARRN
jgi:phosphoribosylformylglycinamidine (FGAM) synthase-like enzyme